MLSDSATNAASCSPALAFSSGSVDAVGDDAGLVSGVDVAWISRIHCSIQTCSSSSMACAPARGSTASTDSGVRPKQLCTNTIDRCETQLGSTLSGCYYLGYNILHLLGCSSTVLP